MRTIVSAVLLVLLGVSMTVNSTAPVSGSAVDKKVLEETHQAALLGDNEARIDMGLSSGDRKDQLYWFGLAARDGNRTAQHNLASVYQSIGDSRKAIYWWKKAASAGDPEAARHVAMAYQIGEGVTKSLELEYVWRYVAASLGVLDCERIHVLQGHLTTKKIEHANRYAKEILSMTGVSSDLRICQ